MSQRRKPAARFLPYEDKLRKKGSLHNVGCHFFV
nr:MAG TPA: hypothetical protein [Caudoviricetes sp.]